MIHFYRIILPHFSLIIFFSSLFGQSVQAQPDTLIHHKIWVKLDSSLPAERYSTAHEGGSIHTGMPSFDELSQGCGVVSIRRVFSPTRKFEKAHQYYGLDRWYEVQFVDTLSTPERELAALFCKDKWVTTAEAIPVRTRYYSTTSSSRELNTLAWGNDPRYQDQWHFNNTGQRNGTPGIDIRLSSAWPLASGDNRVIVAVIDGGIDVQHEDLQGAIWVNERESAGKPGEDDDGNGYVDDVYGYGFGDERGTLRADRHGTHVAGTIGAINNNGLGVAGVAGGDGTKAGVRLMSCAVFGWYGQGGFPEAFVYAADNGAVIAQNSWGGGDKSQVLEDAITYFTERAGYDNTNEKFDQWIQTGPMAGGLVVFAAGNKNSKRPDRAYPASLESVLAVTALDNKDEKADFANYGDWVDIAAPGTDILSTTPRNNYGYLSGTSMACPQVSGVAALAISRFQHQGFTPESLRQLLLGSVDEIDAVNESYAGQLGSGRINAYKALSSTSNLPPPPVTDLTASAATFHSVVLNWTVDEGDSTSGTPVYYEIKGSPKPIDSDNFDEIQPLDTIVYLHPAGDPFSVEIDGLRPTTSYYFALKAVSLMGRRSPLSNSASATTLEPPRIRVQPDRLIATLEARQSGNDTLVIDNSLGKSDLSFHISMEQPRESLEWFRLSSDSGVVAAGKSKAIRIRWDARRLNASDNRSNLRVTSNDPEHPLIEVPVHLMVVGTPALRVSAPSVNFGNVYFSFSKKISFEIRNTGTDTLKVESLKTDNPVFQIANLVPAIPPGEDRRVDVTFSPEAAEAYENTLIIQSNDPYQASYSVSLQGQGVIPPLLLPTPEDILVELEQQDSLLRRVRIQNTSFTDSLQWTVDEELPAWLSLSVRSGSLAPRAIADLPVALSAKEMEVGEYAANVRFQLSEDDSVHLPVTIRVIPPNKLPVWADSLPEFTVHTDGPEVQIDLTDFSSDPEGGPLQFDFQSEGERKAYVQIIGSVLSLKPEKVGVFQGVLTATDERSGQASVVVSIEVLPANRSPESVTPTVAVELRFSDQPFALALDTLFFDPDGDSLIYSFARPFTSPEDLVILEDSVVSLHIEQQRLIGLTNASGQGKVIVFAYDLAGAYTTIILDFTVLPPNHAPLVQQQVDPASLTEQEQFWVNLTTLFTDPDNDTLVYEVEVGDAVVAQVAIEADTLHITALASGETSVTVTARDEAGESVSYSFDIIVARVTAIEPSLAEEGLQMYPNPASDRVTITHPNAQKLQVYDSQGRLVYERQATVVGELHFSVASLPPGIYQIVLFTLNGPVRASLIRE